jgi:predicted dienelactone hydrolase
MGFPSIAKGFLMRSTIAFAFAIFLAAACGPSQAAVGFQHFTIPDPQGQPIEVGVWYPTDAVAKTEPIEADQQIVARDGAVNGERLRLVMISHGHGGSYAGHFDTALALANAGFVAAALTHNGDNWRDQGHPTAIWERPRELKVVTDYMLNAWRDHGSLDAERVGAFGFSAGGMTVLIAAGGEPDLGALKDHCQDHPLFEDCQIVGRNPLPADQKFVWTHDPRIKAVVSAAPALGFAFGGAGLAAARQPLQLWRAADDQVLPHPYYAEAVREALPIPPESHVVASAGHYDFLAPCSARLAERVPAICTSAAGFDRAAFHEQFNRDVTEFFTRTLRSAQEKASR